MIHVVSLPIGTSATDEFIEGALQQGYEQSLVITSSQFMVQKARLRGVNARNFDYLANDILRQCAKTDVRLLSRKAQAIILQKILQQLQAESRLSYYVRLLDKKGFLHSMLSLIGQLGRSNVTVPEVKTALQSWDRSGSRGTKDRETELIYERYRDYLKTHRVYDVEGLYRLAAEALRERLRKGGCVKWRALFFTGFYHFDALQLEILAQLGQCCDVWIALLYEGQRPELYGVTEFLRADLLGIQDAEEVRRETVVGRGLAIEHLLRNLRREKPTQIPCNDTVEIWEARDRSEEMRTVLRAVKMRIAAGKVRADQIGIIVRNPEDYSGFRRLCDEYGIPVQLPGTASLPANPLFTYVAALFSTVGLRGRRQVEAWQTFFTHPLQGLLFGVAVHAAEQVAASRYYTNPEAFTDTVLAIPGWAVLTSFVQRFSALGAGTVKTFAQALEATLTELSLAEKMGVAYREGQLSLPGFKNLITAQKEMREVLRQLEADYEAGGLSDTAISSSEFWESMAEGATHVTLRLQPGQEEGVALLAAADLTEESFTYVYVLGLREHEFPCLKHENWLYDDKEREDLKALGLDLPRSVDSYQEDLFFFATACAAAKERLFLTYFTDEERTVSPYIEEVRTVFSDLKIRVPRSAGEKEKPTLSRAELELALARQGKKTLLQQRTSPLLVKAAIVDTERTGSGRMYNGRIEETAVLKALQQKIGAQFSASKLEMYLNCPFSFLAFYGWNQEKAESMEEDMNPMTRGNLLHKVLEQFIGAHLGEKFTLAQQPDLQQELDGIFDRLCEKEEAAGRIYAGPFWQYDKEQQRKLLHYWLKKEIEYSGQSEFRPVAVEKSFGRGKAAALSLQVGVCRISLNGSIDRVDRSGKDYFVTDYKSGKTPAQSDFLQKDLQLPLYLLALHKMLQEEPAATVSGGGYYALAEGVRKTGFQFADNKALLPVKSFQEVIPPGKTEKETLHHMDELQNMIQEAIRSLLERMAAGDFAPTPAPGCERFCPAADICRFCILPGNEESEAENGDA